MILTFNVITFIKRFAVSIILVFPILGNCSVSGVKEYHLDNGLTILVRENHRSPIVVSEIWYKVGSSYERLGKTGLSHVLEHMMFEGSKQYPDQSFTQTMGKIGAEFNAATVTDYTYFYETTSIDHLEQLFKMEADRMTHLNLSNKAFEKEIEVVKEERRLRTENDPQALTLEYLYSQANIGSPYANPTIGWMRDLDQINIADVSEWYQKWYAPNNATLVVVGDVLPEHVLSLAEKYFGSIPAKTLPSTPNFISIPQIGERTLKVQLPGQVPWLAMAYNVPSLKSAVDPKEAYALTVIGAVLSEGESSWLTNDLVRSQRIATNLDVSYSPFDRLASLFIIYGSPRAGHSLDDLRSHIFSELQKLQTQKITPHELQKVKIAVEAQHIYNEDSIINQANELGSLVSIGLPWNESGNFVKQIQNITPDDIQKAAQKYFIPARLTTAFLYPIQPNQTSANQSPKNLKGNPHGVEIH